MSYLCLRYFKMMWRSLALLTLFATLAAAGIDRLVAPRIIEPNECTVWQSGETVIISWVWPSWNALPKDKAILALGTLEAGASEQYVKLGPILATHFDLDDGSLELTLPCDLEERSDYVLVLLGSLGGISQRFEIVSGEEEPSYESETVEGQLVLGS